eukprot:scaffold114811_cov80-Phaeocystis_antarctica.AAC.2
MTTSFSSLTRSRKGPEATAVAGSELDKNEPTNIIFQRNAATTHHATASHGKHHWKNCCPREEEQGVHKYRAKDWQSPDHGRVSHLTDTVCFVRSFVGGALQQEERIAPPDAILKRLRLWGDRTIAQDGVGTDGAPGLQHGAVGNKGARLESDAPEARARWCELFVAQHERSTAVATALNSHELWPVQQWEVRQAGV